MRGNEGQVSAEFLFLFGVLILIVMLLKQGLPQYLKLEKSAFAVQEQRLKKKARWVRNSWQV